MCVCAKGVSIQYLLQGGQSLTTPCWGGVTVGSLKSQGCYVRYFSAKSALRAFNLWGALECVKSALYLLCFHKI